MPVTSDLNFRQGSGSSGRNSRSSPPIDPTTLHSWRNPNNSGTNGGNTADKVRSGAGSPGYESTASARLFSKRAREIQAEEGVSAPPGLWGHSSSSSLRDRENVIPENPSTDSESNNSQSDYTPPQPFRRSRAGTVPSRFSPGGIPGTAPPNFSNIPQTSRPSPAPSPFGANRQNVDNDTTPISVPAGGLDSKSRLRSGSLNIAPRTNFSGFGSSIFGPGSWTQTRERGATISQLPMVPSSPANSSYSRDEDASHMAPKTLDYLGLVDTPQTTRATMAKPGGLDTLIEGQRAAAMQPFVSEMPHITRSMNRIRSYSVNAKEKYAADEEEMEENMYGQYSGTVTPTIQTPTGLNTPVTAAQHAMALAAYANNIQSNRPRARTAGVLDSPPVNRMKSYLATPSKLRAGDTPELEGGYFDVGTSSDTLRVAGMNQPRPSSGEGGLASIEESSLEGPTRSLWLGNIPASTTTTSLIHIFQNFGPVESARVLTHKNCGFINYERVESAMQARLAHNGKEIFPGAGPTRIGFAKPSSAGNNSGTPTPNGGAYGSSSPDPTSRGDGAIGLSRGNSNAGINGSREHKTIDVPEIPEIREDILKIVRDFGAEDEDVELIAKMIEHAIEYNDFEKEIPPIPEPSQNRVHDAPKLRDIRKRIDNNSCSQSEIEDIAIAMLPEVAELSSDYLGNTVVQKLFEFCSEEIKETMLVEIGPHLAEIGIHKNGTWAGQKIIDVAKTPAQMTTICDCLKKYTVALFLDQYGNYVLQCCLRFQTPYSDYIFETMLNRMWEISQGRFGARAMRACLESHHAGKNHQRMMAAAISMFAVQLATNTNGALLLTWFLDTCNLPRRRTVLAPRLVPHLVHLCTHKLAYLTVLKVINQKNEPEARDIILQALFFSPGDKVLEDILRDHSCGATLIFKVLTTPFLEDEMRSDVLQTVRNVLTKLKAAPSQGYKRLMDEVGMSTRNGMNGTAAPKEHGQREVGSDRRPSQNPAYQGSQAGVNRDNIQPPGFYGGPGLIDPAVLAASVGYQGAPAMDQNTLRAFQEMNLNNMGYGTASPAMAQQALQYQQLLASQQARAGGAPFFGGMSPVGFNPNQAADAFRAATAGQGNGSPMMAPSPMLSAGMMPSPAFNPVLAMAGYPYALPMNGMSGMFSPTGQQQSPGSMNQQQQQQAQQQAQQQQGGRNNSRGSQQGRRRGPSPNPKRGDPARN